MCKIVAREGTATCKFGGDACIGLENIARKRWGAINSHPVGARANVRLMLMSLAIHKFEVIPSNHSKVIERLLDHGCHRVVCFSADVIH